MIKELLDLIDVVGIKFALSVLFQILRVLSVSICGLSLVYVFGRELNILKTDRSKNLLALISMAILSFVETYLFYFDKWSIIIWQTFLITMFANIIYVLIGFKLYDRVDHFQDKRFADDTIRRIERKNKK